MAASSSPYVTLISNDGFEFIIRREAACVAGTIKKMLDPQSACALPFDVHAHAVIYTMRVTILTSQNNHRFLRRIDFRPMYSGHDKVRLSPLPLRLRASYTILYSFFFFFTRTLAYVPITVALCSKKSASTCTTISSIKTRKTCRIWRYRRNCAWSCWWRRIICTFELLIGRISAIVEDLEKRERGRKRWHEDVQEGYLIGSTDYCVIPRYRS